MRAHKDHNILRYWKSILMKNETIIPLCLRFIENSCQFSLEMNIIYAYYCMNTFYCQEPTMKPHRDNTEKHKRLQQAGTLNTTPEKILDPMFSVAGDFFDAHDLLQVRYEMIRLVRIEHATLAEAAKRFGVSRPTCFRMSKAFDRNGLQGLIPAPRGPRGPHKITPQMLDFVVEYKSRHGRVGARRLVPLIEQRFGITVHPRGLEKALARGKKKLEDKP